MKNLETDQQGASPREQVESGAAEAASKPFVEAASRSYDALMQTGLDAWNLGAGMRFLSWEQADRMTRLWLEQGRLTREQAQRLQGELAELARSNQAELQRIVQSAVQAGMAGFARSQQSALDEMQRRMDEMARQLEELRRSGSAGQR
jgi:polyhydroxyalkanoate synthesis regulator phasin